jgi:hypothetical protein
MLNRLIILGNGFDLAHGLKTGYSDFMKDYYLNIKNFFWKDNFFEFDVHGVNFESFDNLNSVIDHIASYSNDYFRYSSKSNSILFNHGRNIKIHNTFFYELSTIHSVQNWVDIENEYFKKMLKIIDNPLLNTHEEIEKLNNDMDLIAKKFEAYLVEKVVPEIANKNNQKMDNEISDDEVFLPRNNDIFYREFPRNYANLLKTHNSRISNSGKRFLSTLVLNFNYTHTFKELYLGRKIDIEIINIHGSLNDTGNPINLGFGDEMSKRYGEIEDYNENEYLRLMKSFAYSQTDNYKRLFDFIDSLDFQVYIMGHSCGLSDRTLLNAIFESPKCKSIKVFYHERTLEDGTKKDNYPEIVMNISRHFNKKIMMREKIVNKSLCNPLPQNIS